MHGEQSTTAREDANWLSQDINKRITPSFVIRVEACALLNSRSFLHRQYLNIPVDIHTQQRSVAMGPIPTQPRDLGDISRSQSHSLLEKLPSELQTAIAFHLPSAPDVINLAWSSKSLFHNIGPANRFLWYRIRYRWEQHFASKGHTVSTFNPNKLGAIELQLIPGFDENPQRNYYQECLDILCSRYEHEVCQVCFGPWGHIKVLATRPGYPEGYILKCYTHCQISWKDEEDNPIPDPNAMRWGSLAGQGTENTQQLYTLQLFSLCIGGIFYKMLCQACASDITSKSSRLVLYMLQ